MKRRQGVNHFFSLNFTFFVEKEADIVSPSLFFFVWHEVDITVLFGLIF